MPITAQLVLCDAAESVNAKLYILGGGWSRIQLRGTPIRVVVAVIFLIPAAEAGTHAIDLELLDSNEERVETDDGPFIARGPMQLVEEPAGDDDIVTSTAVVTIDGLTLEPGTYFVRLLIDDAPAATSRFVAWR